MTNSTAVEKVKDKALATGKALSIEDLVRQSAEQLKMALPEHMRPERIVRIALTTLKTTPKLYECDPYSFLAALFQSAQLGLEPNLNGEAWIIPYLVKGKMMAQFQIGAYGLVKLYWNHQNSGALQVETVKKNDVFEYDLGTGSISHKLPAFGNERGDSIAYYAFASLVNGGKVLKVMSKEEVFQFARKFSKCFLRNEAKFMPGTPWAEHFDAMAQKTVLKQLMKLLPKSIEIQRALAMDETVKTKIDADMVTVPDVTDYSELPEKEVAGELTEEEKRSIIEAEKAQ